MARYLEVQLKPQMSDSYNPIGILGFLPALEMAGDKNGIYEKGGMWLFHFFMEKPARAASNARTCLTISSS